ncbi:hypothetical protein AAMO2058_000171300 [Amorphochlora amoebiformis]
MPRKKQKKRSSSKAPAKDFREKEKEGLDSYELPKDFEDEEIDEDGAFNEQDYELYGDVGNTKADADIEEASDIDEGDGIDLSDMLEKNLKRQRKEEKKAIKKAAAEAKASGSLSTRHDHMLRKVSQLNQEAALTQKQRLIKDATTQQVARSQFLAEREVGVVLEGGGEGETENLTFDDLVASFDNNNNNEIADQLRILKNNKAAQPLALPLSDSRKGQVEREVAYKETSKEVSKWTGEPKFNLSTEGLTTKFTPSNDLEKDFTALLQHYGMGDEKKIEDREGILLGADGEGLDDGAREEMLNKLRKQRSLMFQHEIKLKRIKKIKSRTFRKLLKKRKEKNKLSIAELEALDPQAAEQEKAKQEAKRIQERMSLKHKNTSKRVQRLIRLAKNNPAMKGVHKLVGQQLNIGNELRKKMLTAEDTKEMNPDESEDEFDVETEENKLGLIVDDEDMDRSEKVRAITEMQLKLQDDVQDRNNKPKKGLMGMRFMQRAMKKRAQAASKLLEDLKSQLDEEDEETKEDPDSESDNFLPMPTGTQTVEDLDLKSGMTIQPNTQGKLEFDINDSSDEETDKPLLSPPPPPAIPTDSKASKKKPKNKKDEIKNNSAPADQEAEDDEFLEEKKAEKGAKGGDDKDDEYMELNPWMISTNRKGNSNNKEEHVMKMENAITVNSKSKNKLKLSHSSVAIGGFDDVEEDFQKEKYETENEEYLKEQEKSVSVPGWGAWGGEGVKPRKSRKRKAKEAAEELAKKSAGKKKKSGPRHVIVNHKRNKKAKKYTLESVPYPYTSKEQYEMSLRQPLGKEWNTLRTFQEITKPEVFTRTGEIIAPISSKELKKYAPEKKPRKKSKKRKH